MSEPEKKPVDFGIGQLINTKLQDGLAEYVKRKFDEAKRHKDNIGITSKLARNLRAKLCEYQPDELELIASTGVDVYVGIAALKQRAAESWLIDIIVNNIEKPWTLNATPSPDLPDRLKEKVVDVLLAELPHLQGFAALKDRATQLKSAVQQISTRAAEETVARMETQVHDQLSEGGWTPTFAEFVSQLTTYPTAFLRGPIEVGSPKPHWNVDKLEVKSASKIITRTISPFNAFPAPNASSPNSGDYFIERVDYTYSDVYDLINVPTFSVPNIRAALDAYESTGLEAAESVREDKKLQLKDETLGQTSGDLETLIYNGKVPGKFLIEHGVLVKDPQKHYEAEVWVVGDYTIRAILNPNPLGKRPIYATSFVKIPGMLWGNSVIDLVYDVQRTCNAAVRAMIRNMPYASGPVGEVNNERLADTDDSTAIAPYKLYKVGPDLTGTGAPAFKFHNIASIGAELMGVFERWLKVADDLSGVPAYVLGNPQVAGAGRTLGGLSMLMGNAAKGIKNVQLNIDREIITEVVEAYYYYNMLVSDDLAIKADAKVVARGATGLLQRELAQTRTVEILQLLAPFMSGDDPDPIVPKDTARYLLREVLKNTGLDVDKAIPDPFAADKQQELSGLLGSPNPPIDVPGAPPDNLPPQSQPSMPGFMQPYPVPVNLAQGA